MNWTVKQLLGGIAAILVRLENGRDDDAKAMAELIVGDTQYHCDAFAEFEEEFAEEFEAGCFDDIGPIIMDHFEKMSDGLIDFSSDKDEAGG